MSYNTIESKIISRECKIEDLTKELDLLYQSRYIEGFSKEITIAQLELIISEIQVELDNLYTLQNLIEITIDYS